MDLEQALRSYQSAYSTLGTENPKCIELPNVFIYNNPMALTQMTVFVTPEIAEQIKLLAKERSTSISSLASRYLELGFKGGTAEEKTATILPTLQHHITKTMRSEYHRQAYFLVRVLIEVNAIRRQVYSGQVAQGGQEKAKAAFDRSYENAVKSLKTRFPEVAELVTMLEGLEGQHEPNS